MSMRQPMGVSGIDTDITTGFPRQPKTREEADAELNLKETRAQVEAVKILQELPAVATIMARELESRLMEIMKVDSQCLSILRMAATLRMKIDVGPLVASKIRRAALGSINSFVDETTVAPERDTDLAQ